MRVVVTGAGGFLGSHLCPRLTAAGHEVVALSRRPAPGRQVVTDYRETPPGDVLIHLAQEPDRARFNAGGEAAVSEALSLLDALLERPWRGVVYASSAAVYGDCCRRPAGPGDRTGPTDPYSRCKLACETRVLERDGTVARLGNLYGEGMARGSVVAEILAQIPGRGPLRVRDTGPVCDFLHVGDAAAALAAMAGQREAGVFNVGSGSGISVGELAALALELAGEGERPIEAESPSPSPPCRVLDIAATTQAFGWHPVIGLRQGLAPLLAGRLDVH